MSNNAERAGLLAAGYLLGRTKSLKPVLMVASGVVAGQASVQNDQQGESSGSIAQRLTSSPEMQRITAGLGEAARGAVMAAANKGVEALNQNLQNRSAVIQGESSSPADEPSESTDSESSGDSEDQADETAEKATKGGGR